MITKEKLDELVKRLRESAHADELTQHAYGDAMWKNQASDALECLAARAEPTTNRGREVSVKPLAQYLTSPEREAETAHRATLVTSALTPTNKE